jgi:hypothetical protein
MKNGNILSQEFLTHAPEKFTFFKKRPWYVIVVCTVDAMVKKADLQ